MDSAPPLLGFLLLLLVPFYSHTFTSCVVPNLFGGPTHTKKDIIVRTLLPSFAWKLAVLTRVSGLLPNYIPHHLPPTIFSFSTLTWEMWGLNDSWVSSFLFLNFHLWHESGVLNACIFFIISEQQWEENQGSRGLNFTTILHNFSVTWKLANNFEGEHFVFKRIFGVTMRSDVWMKAFS
jgi:hypothetical protein